MQNAKMVLTAYIPLYEFYEFYKKLLRWTTLLS